MIPVFSFAAEIVDSGTLGTKVTWTLDDEGTLTISGTGNIPYNSGNGLFYANRYNIFTVIINNGVTGIGSRAFYVCSNLTDIMIPNSVTSINSKTFNSCSSLTSIELPVSVNSVASSAFDDCTALESVYFYNPGCSAYTYCSVCGETLAEETEEIAKTAHIDADNDGICDECKQNISGGSGEQENNVCKYCGKVHPDSLIGKLTKFFHSVAYFFAHLFGKM